MIKRLLRKVLGIGYRNLDIELACGFVGGRNIEGDYFEFGVYKGDSFSYAYSQLQNARMMMREYHLKNHIPVPVNLEREIRYFAFDSFQGLPHIDGTDLTNKLPSHWQKGQFCASKDCFLSNIKKKGVNLSNVVIVDGWYESTLNDETKRLYDISKGCIFYIDCDLYESTKLALDFIRDVYVDGSVLIFDDWFGFKGNPKYGEQKAFREWQAKYNIPASEFSRSDGQRVSFILHAD